jgi:hypothetical protein
LVVRCWRHRSFPAPEPVCYWASCWACPRPSSCDWWSGTGCALASPIGIRVPGKDAAESETETVSAEQKKAAAFRAGVFGLTCVAALLIGIYLRTHNVLSPSEPTLTQQMYELVGLGFDAKEARRIAVLRAYGDGAEQKSAGGGKSADLSAALRNTHLFSSSAERCEQIRVDRFKDMSAGISWLAKKGV